MALWGFDKGISQSTRSASDEATSTGDRLTSNNQTSYKCICSFTTSSTKFFKTPLLKYKRFYETKEICPVCFRLAWYVIATQDLVLFLSVFHQMMHMCFTLHLSDDPAEKLKTLQQEKTLWNLHSYKDEFKLIGIIKVNLRVKRSSWYLLLKFKHILLSELYCLTFIISALAYEN